MATISKSIGADLEPEKAAELEPPIFWHMDYLATSSLTIQ